MNLICLLNFQNCSYLSCLGNCRGKFRGKIYSCTFANVALLVNICKCQFDYNLFICKATFFFVNQCVKYFQQVFKKKSTFFNIFSTFCPKFFNVSSIFFSTLFSKKNQQFFQQFFSQNIMFLFNIAYARESKQCQGQMLMK